MTNETQTQPSGSILDRVSDFWAYVLPMAIFLVFTQFGAWYPAIYPHMYVAKTLIVPVALILFWPRYTKIRWNHWWLGIIVGVAGVFQWVAMQLWLQRFEFFKPSPGAFDPSAYFDGRPELMWAFIIVRLAGASLVVPVMEELFWRDALWRTIIAPNDFKLAQVGEWDWKAFLGVSGAFSLVHGNWWLTAIVWGLMVATLLVYTKSLGACIIAHGVTNLLLGLYVLHTKEWFFW
jgi:CAAX prenyl protease-like protein